MNFVRKQLLVYAAIGIVVVAVGARFLFTNHSAAGNGGAPGVALAAAASPAPSMPDSAAPSPSTAAEVVVDVAGAVVRPGVYRLPAGSRVCDALDLAGGTTARAQTAAVNLAAPLVDGQQVAIPEKTAAGTGVVGGTGQAAPAASTPGAAAAAAGVGGTPAAPVNLNTATLEQLDALSGVGPSTAQKIIDYREQQGGFRSVDELQEVSGIGDAKFAALKDQVTI